MPAKVAFGALHGIIPVVLFTLNAVRNVNRTYLRAGRRHAPHPGSDGLLRPGPCDLARDLLQPAHRLLAHPARHVLGELFASQRGLGFLLMTAIGLHDVKTILSVPSSSRSSPLSPMQACSPSTSRLHRGGGAGERPEKS